MVGQPILTFHYDGAHGWLEVPTGVLVHLGIVSQISGFSYQYGYNAYLEEDADLYRFAKAAKAAGFEYTERKVYDGTQSEIRNYAQFGSRPLPIICEGDKVEIPSGMGGIFTVDVKRIDWADCSMVVAIDHKHDDWHGRELEINPSTASFKRGKPYCREMFEAVSYYKEGAHA